MRRLILFGLAIGFYGLLAGYLTATAPPVVRRIAFRLAGYPAEASPTRLVLISDSHVSGPDMPPERLSRIVTQVNDLQPDIVLIAGDFMGHKLLPARTYPVAATIAPFADLRPRIATIAVLGNHDLAGRGVATTRALSRAGVIVLNNDAVRAGPLAIGGIVDPVVAPADVPATIAKMRRLGGLQVVLSHKPDLFPWLPPSVALMLGGHTHCGQIKLPITRRVARLFRLSEANICGAFYQNGRAAVVTAGLGTSVLPLRIGARPDLWEITLLAPDR